MRLTFDPASLDDYRRFLAVRRLPIYEIRGRDAVVPDEYAHLVNASGVRSLASGVEDYDPSSFLFDYQAAISRIAIRKRKFAAFVECGLGKTLIMLEFSMHAARRLDERPVLIVSPLMVIPQTLAEAERFYPGVGIQQVRAAGLQDFLDRGRGLGITNYEAFSGLRQPLRVGQLGALVVDESSMLKSHYGKWGTEIIRLGAGLDWKLALTGTPAPNDRIEYANHAVFLDSAKTVNEFLARYFINRGQTDNRWEIKPHALGHFYRDLSHWCIFLSDPAVYGWKDNAGGVPPIQAHIHQIDLTDEQVEAAYGEGGVLFTTHVGGIGTRSKLGQIAKGFSPGHGPGPNASGRDGAGSGRRIATNKPAYIRGLVDSWPEESTLIWCIYNDEQARVAEQFPEAANITGATPVEARLELIAAFKSGQLHTLISKGKILGFGLNLQRASRQVFSGLQDSYETYWQCVKRSNRIGSTRPLNVHIPLTSIEEPMVATVLRKAARVEEDTRVQERLFRERSCLAV